MSSFGWLAFDAGEREHTLKVVESLKVSGTVDELGIGVIRDTIARALFPGASVLHSRARYFTAIPALVAQAVSAPTAEAAATRLKRLEGDLILALLAADPDDWGIIGRDAKRDLKRMPSMSYWAALRRYGLVTVDHSLDQLLRAAVGSGRAGARAPENPDGELERHAAFGLDPVAAKGWLPANWKHGVTFELEAKEAEFLRERIMLGTGDSLYAWFLRHRVDPGEWRYLWDHPECGSFPQDLASLVEHGRRFHHLMHGAALLYNLLVSELALDDVLTQRYASAIAEWRETIGDLGILDDWSIETFLLAVSMRNPQLKGTTATFVRLWASGVARADEIPNDVPLRELITKREWHTKRSRGRLVNPAARDGWEGGAGLVPLDYNWRVAQGVVGDILKALPQVSS